jgi:hypothetical protein
MSDVLKGLEGYTPGLWEVASGPPACVPSKSVTSGPGGTVYVEDRRRRATIVAEYTYTMANARLIARAPELVEEVRRLREALRECANLLDAQYTERDGEPATNWDRAAAGASDRARALLPETKEE